MAILKPALLVRARARARARSTVEVYQFESSLAQLLSSFWYNLNNEFLETT